MSNQYLGEIRVFAGNFAPVGWLACDGSLLSIAQFDALFALIGTTYGGDGQTTFALPDLRGRWPMHVGTNFQLGQVGGEEQITLTTNQIPVHSHTLTASSVANSSSPEGGTPAPSALPRYATPGSVGASDEILPSAVAAQGGSQPHENRSPYLGLTFIISVEGIFPSVN
jgi:microcystin-dependent protein